MSLARGTRIGAYEILELLGAGGMGEVYRAQDAKLRRSVAIKVLNRAPDAHPATLRRFETEARAASALNHPGIVTIHDTGQSDGHFYIVMELVGGVTLRHLLRRGAPRLKKALHLAAQLASALATAHAAGVVHRDLKPENVMVTRDDHVKIVDFGLAKLGPPEAGPDTAATQSGAGAMLGTVGYMAPEQVRGEPTDFRADQFAFGGILYELVTGTRAFARDTAVDTMAMILHEEPIAPRTITPTLPPPVSWIIERCLAKDADDRYASTRDLARDVQTIAERAGEIVARGTRPAAPRWRRVALAAALIVALGAVTYEGLPRSGGALPPAGPRFSQLTFGRGHIANARFAPDGATIFYAASWGGAPVQVFETRLTGPESRPLGPPGASLASVSSTGELALILGCRFDWGTCVGTLARMPQGGGAPREIVESVVSADWTPDGDAIAAIQATGGEYQVQFPPAKPLYTSTRKLGFLRFSPSGDKLAFVEYELLNDEQGVAKVIDLHGKVIAVSERWEEVRELAWSPDGDEIWVSANEHGRSANIHVVSLSGRSRMMLQAPGSLYVQDVLPDRRVLVAQGAAHSHMLWTSGNAREELSWLDWSTVADLSADGETILFYEWGHAVGTKPVVYLRKVDRSDAIRLGDGTALALSPDTRWALALRETPTPHLVLLPTGAGVSRVLPSHGLTDIYWARWFPDSRRLLVVGDGEGGPGSYIQHLDNGRLDPIAEKGMLAMLVSPDGGQLLINDPLEGYLIWPIGGGPSRTLRGLTVNQRPVQWSADGRDLYVKGEEDNLVRLYKFHIANGTLEFVRELAPRDPAGVVGLGDGRNDMAVTPDGKSYVFSYWRFVRDLYLVEGLSQ